MAGTNRTGRVSAIDYKAGTYEVTYFDRGKSVTRQINAISNGEYKMPSIGQVVSVSHNSNGAAAGTTTGTVWNKTNTPAEGYKGLFRKEYAARRGLAYERYDENTGVYTQYVNRRTGRNCNGEIYDEAKGAISLVAGGQFQAKSSAASMSLNAKTGVGIVAGTTVSIEAGTFVSIEAAGALSVTAGGKYTFAAKKGRKNRGGGRRRGDHHKRRNCQGDGGRGCGDRKPNQDQPDSPGDQRHGGKRGHHHQRREPRKPHAHERRGGKAG